MFIPIIVSVDNSILAQQSFQISKLLTMSILFTCYHVLMQPCDKSLKVSQTIFLDYIKKHHILLFYLVGN